MKKILYIMCAVLLATSCTNDLGDEQQIGMQNVVLSVTSDFSYGDDTMEPMGVATRATATVNNYKLELYSDAQYATKVHSASSTDGEFALTLDRTKEYYALLWADNDNTIYNTGNLTAVTLNTGKQPVEAFFGKVTIRGKSATLSVTLKHAVAKVNLCDKNGMAADKSVNLKYSFYPTFNTVDGTVSGTAVAQDYNITSVAAAAGESFGSFLLLAPSEASTFALTFKAENEEEATTVENITYQANCKTNIKGEYVVVLKP